MTQHCPLSKFNNNSAIRRAVSSSPGEPFSGGEIVFPPFAHNPTVTTTPDGTIPLLYIGAPEHRQFNCSAPDGTAGRTASPLASTAQHPALRWKPQTDVINIAWSNPQPALGKHVSLSNQPSQRTIRPRGTATPPTPPQMSNISLIFH